MRKRYSPELKTQIVLAALREEKTIAQLAAEHQVHPNQISAWKAAALQGLPQVFARETKTHADKAAHEQQIEELYAQIGKLTTQVACPSLRVDARLKKIWPRPTVEPRVWRWQNAAAGRS